MLDTNILFTYQFSFSTALTCAKSALQSTKGKENNSLNRYGNPNATRGFLAGNRIATRTSKEKKRQQSPVFSNVIYLYFMSTLTWITDKKIKNKEDEFRWK